jgi:membrane-bound lytic murein transglycosylase A
MVTYMIKRTFLGVIFLFSLVACNSQVSQPKVEKSENSLNFNTYYDGKDTLGEIFTKTYEIRNSNSEISSLDEQTLFALDKSEQYLNRKKKRTHNINGLSVSDNQLLKANRLLKAYQNDGSTSIFDNLNAHQLCGEDNRGNVHFTGYFIPVVKVSKTKDEVYKYPLYRKPKSGKLPSRKQIDDNNALANRGLELCYSNDLLDNFLMQVQGSGIVEYEDGTKELLSYGGENGHRYRSIGKYLVAAGHVPKEKISLEAIKIWCAENPDSVTTLLNRNPSFVFFNKSKKEPSGAAGVPLSAFVSVAVDKRYVPLGSTLLVAVPVLDDNGNFIGHEYKIATAQDVGGAIKGKGRMDFFCGTGEAGKKRSGALNHYGKVWLLLPK